jgi:hypothetical protein
MPSNRPNQRSDSNDGNKLQLFEFDAATDAKLWDIVVSGGVLTIRTRTDEDADGSDVLSVTRSGTGLTIVALAPAMVPAADDDTAAAALDPVVPIGGLYRTASALKIRVA